ncbi:MAG: hypothetical protein GY696_24025 [Gammaproteobacteria bacterium]|nr:hypothetical protein [Gammaproteobacteria bacterium]
MELRANHLGVEIQVWSLFTPEACLSTPPYWSKIYRMPQIAIREINMQRNTAVALKYIA